MRFEHDARAVLDCGGTGMDAAKTGYGKSVPDLSHRSVSEDAGGTNHEKQRTNNSKHGRH